jgi:hypothetical protein
MPRRGESYFDGKAGTNVALKTMAVRIRSCTVSAAAFLAGLTEQVSN